MRTLVHSLGLAGAAVALAGCATAPASVQLVPGAEAPAFSLPRAGGGPTVELAGLRGRVVLVDFFASWCEPCRDSMPLYAELRRRAGERLEIVAVSLDEDPQALERFLAEVGPLPFLVVHDRDHRSAEAYRVMELPTAVLVDAAGREVWRRSGFDEREVRRALEQALATPPALQGLPGGGKS